METRASILNCTFYVPEVVFTLVHSRVGGTVGRVVKMKGRGMLRKQEFERRGSCGQVREMVIGVGQNCGVFIPIILMHVHTVSEHGKNCAVVALDLINSFGMIRAREDIRNGEKGPGGLEVSCSEYFAVV